MAISSWSIASLAFGNSIVVKTKFLQILFGITLEKKTTQRLIAIC